MQFLPVATIDVALERGKTKPRLDYPWFARSAAPTWNRRHGVRPSDDEPEPIKEDVDYEGVRDSVASAARLPVRCAPSISRPRTEWTAQRCTTSHLPREGALHDPRLVGLAEPVASRQLAQDRRVGRELKAREPLGADHGLDERAWSMPTRERP